MSDLSERACAIIKDRTTERLAREVSSIGPDIIALYDDKARALSNVRSDGQIECALELLISAASLLKGVDSHVLRASSHLRRSGRRSGEVAERLEAIKRDAKRLVSAVDQILVEGAPVRLQAAE